MIVGGIEPLMNPSTLGREKDMALTGSGLGRKLFETTLVTEIVWATFRAIAGLTNFRAIVDLNRLGNVGFACLGQGKKENGNDR